MLLQGNMLQHLLSIPSCKAWTLLLSTATASSCWRCEHPRFCSCAACCFFFWLCGSVTLPKRSQPVLGSSQLWLANPKGRAVLCTGAVEEWEETECKIQHSWCFCWASPSLWIQVELNPDLQSWALHVCEWSQKDLFLVVPCCSLYPNSHINHSGVLGLLFCWQLVH